MDAEERLKDIQHTGVAKFADVGDKNRLRPNESNGIVIAFAEMTISGRR